MEIEEESLESNVVRLYLPRYVHLLPFYAVLRLLSRSKVPFCHLSEGIANVQKLTRDIKVNKLDRD